MTKHTLSALVAAGLLSCGLPTTSASAADLGGSCCADLEERVAELEATTARKGNRKVSLTVSGWVAEQITFWDDGVESNAYVGGIGTTLATHFKFTGQAQIAPGWSSGYTLHVEAFSSEPLTVNQFVDDSTVSTESLGLLQSFWFLQSDRLGKLGVGLQSQASDNAALLVDGSGSLVPANWVLFDGPGFFLRDEAGRFVPTGVGGNLLTWGDIAFCHHIGAGIAADCNGVPLNSVRYDTPTIHGFSFAASWGADDFWDVAARYAAEWNSVKVAAAVAYSEQKDENPFAGAGPANFERDSAYFQAGLYVQHVPTGLFVYSAYGAEDNQHGLFQGFSTTSPPVPLFKDIPDNDQWYLKAGVRRLWTALGHTVLYGEFAQHDDMISPDLINGILDPGPLPPGTPLGTVSIFTADSSELDRWGVGLVQEIDAAAMSVWVKYRNMEGEVEGTVTRTAPGATPTRTRSTIEFDEIHFFGVGALINF
jgi:hypothetical protein